MTQNIIIYFDIHINKGKYYFTKKIHWHNKKCSFLTMPGAKINQKKNHYRGTPFIQTHILSGSTYTCQRYEKVQIFWLLGGALEIFGSFQKSKFEKSKKKKIWKCRNFFFTIITYHTCALPTKNFRILVQPVLELWPILGSKKISVEKLKISKIPPKSP